MKRLLIKKTVFAASYVILAILLEMITFLALGFGAFPQYFGLDLAVILIIALIIFVIPNSAAQISVLSVFLAFQIILSIANEALYSMSGTVFSFSMLNLIHEVTGVVDASFMNWWLIAVMVVIFGGSLAGLIVFTRKYTVPKGLYTRNTVVLLLVAFILAECCAGILYAFTVESFSAAADQIEKEDRLSIFYDESELYTEQKFTAKAFSEFGTYGYFVVNIGNSISPQTYVDEVTEEDIDNYFTSGRMSKSVYGDNIYTGAADGKNIVLIVIESGEWYVINKEYTPTLYAMAEGGIAMTDFHARDKTNCSEALSIMGSYPSLAALEPANVIGNSMPYTLPNILSNGGYTNNYFHANYGSYYRRSDSFVDMYGYDNTYFLEDLTMLPGSTDKTGFYDFDKDSDIFRYYLDEFTYSEGDGPFFTQMMTLISHGSYNDLIDHGNYPYNGVPQEPGDVSYDEMTEEEKEEFTKKCQVKGLEEYYEIIDRFPETYVGGTPVIDQQYLAENDLFEEMFLRYKRYQAGIMDLDLGVNMLVKDLESSGELDDTLFVFYADHSAYYDQMNYVMKGYGSDELYNTNVYNVPFFMWYGGSMDLNVEALPLSEYSSVDFVATKDTDSALQPGKITKFCNTYDVLPTLLDLCGYSYNTNLYHGVSAFSKLESIFISHESGIFQDDIYFSTIDVYVETGSEWICYPFDETYSNGGFGDYVLDFLYRAVDYYDKQEMLDAVIKCDYFATRDFYGEGTLKFIEKVV